MPPSISLSNRADPIAARPQLYNPDTVVREPNIAAPTTTISPAEAHGFTQIGLPAISTSISNNYYVVGGILWFIAVRLLRAANVRHVSTITPFTLSLSKGK